MDRDRKRIAIVGGGVFGVTGALELAARGHAITLIDPGPLPHPDASSTDISKAVRMDYGADAFYAELGELSIERWRAWNRRYDETLYHETGFLLLTSEPFAPGGYEHDGYRLLTGRGHAIERLDAAKIGERFPAWNPSAYRDGYVNPRGGWAASGRAVERLTADARASGVLVREGARFSRFVESGSRVSGVVVDSGEEIEADLVVVAAGAWTPVLLPEIEHEMWSVGQPVLHFAPEDPEPFLSPVFPVWGSDISTTGWYGFPVNRDGILKVANHGPGTRIHPDRPRRVDPVWEERCRDLFRERLPAAANAPLVATRLCLYCDTRNGDFRIDRHPDRPGLLVAAGGAGHAFKFAPVLGEIIADVALGCPNRFAPRFSWRSGGARASEAARHDPDLR